MQGDRARSITQVRITIEAMPATVGSPTGAPGDQGVNPAKGDHQAKETQDLGICCGQVPVEPGRLDRKSVV